MNLEPERCRYNSNETIEVLYKNQWYSVSEENPARDGIIIMACYLNIKALKDIGFSLFNG